jgi:phenylalanyl-tRNA synthetase beta chain
MHSLSVLDSTAFMFELDGDFIVNYKKPLVRFSSLPKYPSVLRDVSMMVPLSSTVDSIVDSIKKTDARIQSVTLIDFFTKPEWHNQKAVTFHIKIRDNDKTLEHDEVESLMSVIIACLQEYGAVIR